MVVAADRYPDLSVESQVHRNNTYMLRINSGLEAVTEPAEEDHDYLVTLVKARVVPSESGETPSC